MIQTTGSPTAKISSHVNRCTLNACLIVALIFFAFTHTSVQAQNSSNNDVLMDIDFPGGSLNDYVDYLNQRVKNAQLKGLNIFLLKTEVEITVPEIKFQEVPFVTALLVLERIDERIDVNAQRSVIYIRVDNRDSRRPTVMTTVLSVSSILKEHKKADLLSAIEIGIELINSKDTSVSLKMHEETGLLFVSGNNSQLEIVKTIVSQLKASSVDDAKLDQRRMLQDMLESRQGGFRGDRR